MLLTIALFDRKFTNVVAISYTALILNELLTVGYEIRTWYRSGAVACRRCGRAATRLQTRSLMLL